MNNLSWPTCVLLGILLGMGLVAADRSTGETPSASAEAADPDSEAAGDEAGGSGGDGDDGGNGDSGGSGGSGGGDGHPDTGGAPTSGGEYALTLTFDDGPHPAYTPQVLELLDRHDATAVFCVVGRQVREHPELVRRIVASGHRLCNHTFTHDQRLAKAGPDAVAREIARTHSAIEDAVGPDVEVRYFRQPETYVRPEIMPALDDAGLEPLDWTVDPRDWSEPGATSIVQGVLSEVRPGAIVLLHDGGGDRSQTVVALEQILAGLDTAGYRHSWPGDGS